MPHLYLRIRVGGHSDRIINNTGSWILVIEAFIPGRTVITSVIIINILYATSRPGVPATVVQVEKRRYCKKSDDMVSVFSY